VASNNIMFIQYFVNIHQLLQKLTGKHAHACACIKLIWHLPL